MPPGVSSFDFEHASATLAALAHPARLTVMKLVLEKEWDVGSLASVVGLSQSALSQHLKKLRDAGLVSTKRHGQTIFYRSECNVARRIIESLPDDPPPPGPKAVRMQRSE